MQQKNKFALDVGWVFIASVVVLGIQFLRKMILARFLGPEDLGLFSMCIIVGSIFTLIAGFGLEGAIVKYVAEYKEDRRKLSQLVSSALFLVAIFGIISSVVLFSLSNLIASIFDMPALFSLLKIFAIAFPFSLTFTIIFGVLNGLRKMKYYSYADISRAFFAFLIIIIFILTGYGVKGAIFGYAVAEIVIACMFLIYLSKYINLTFRGYVQFMKKLMSFGGKLVGANAINRINYQADIILIGYFLTATEVGHYAVAVALSRFLWLIPQSIQKITYPATSEYWSKNNQAALQKMIDKSMKYTTSILLPIGLGVGFFAKDIVIMVFGRGFVNSILPLQILLIGTVIFGVFKSIGGSLPGIERVDLSLRITSAGALVNVILNILLIPSFGINGAAIATISSYLLITCLSLNFICKLMRVKVDTIWIAKISVFTSVMILLASITNSLANQHLTNLILLCIYGLLIVKFFLTKEDKEYFKYLIRSFPSKI